MAEIKSSKPDSSGFKSSKPDSSGFKSRKEQIKSIHNLLVKANEIEDKELRTEAIETVWSLLIVILDSTKTMP